ncbi:MAG: DUF308 domain-containing protein [Halobacteriaceae archaeon]
MKLQGANLFGRSDDDGESGEGEGSGGSGDGGEGDGASQRLDEVFTTLSNQRRRFVIHRLLQTDRVDVRALSRQLAAWEYGKDTGEVTTTERHRVHIALQQFHLPKLDEKGFVTYDKRAGTVAPTSELQDVALYLEMVPRSEISWSTYYVLLATATGLLTAVTWAGIGPFAAVPLAASAGLTVTLFLGSSLVHARVTRRRRLGSEGAPPELRSGESEGQPDE